MIIDCHYHLEQCLLPVAAELAKTGKPLLIHAGFDAYGDYKALLREGPEPQTDSEN